MDVPPDNDNADGNAPIELLEPETADGVVAIAPVIAKRLQARALYWRGWTITQIASEIDLPYTTVASWKARHKWDDAPAITRAEEGTLERYLVLLAKDKKTGGDFKEIDLLGRQFERLARVRKFQAGGNEADLNPRVKKRNSPEVLARKDAAKNLITPEMVEKLRADLDDKLFGFQRDWLASTSLRTRMIIKSRQIGATWYFARERLMRALETGNNQIFLSASKAQAHIFRNYIVQWVQLVLGITLKGDPLIINRGPAARPDDHDDDDADDVALPPVTLLFLGTNYRTAQGYSGDVIIDEFMWIYGFEQLFDVAAAMATHKQFTRTLFSTPSTMDHEAFTMWVGDKFNKRRTKADRAKIDTSHQALKDGAMGGDRIWRQIVSIFDAVEKGLDRVDVDELQIENSVEVFDNLYRCNFLDDSQSMFPFAMMRRCMIDSWEIWKDFEPYAARPFGDGEVWLGYDPNASESETADAGALVAVAPPAVPGGNFRILEKKRIIGTGYAGQAEAIKEMASRYRVTRIGIDTSGAGGAVLELVSAWFPMAEGYKYSIQTKTALVLKAKDVIAAGRLKFDAGWMDAAQAFMAIRPEMTKVGPTYVASRIAGVGHADIAWAIMHALHFEPLDITKPAGGGSTVEFF
jgi:uncharacterized protein YjcR